MGLCSHTFSVASDVAASHGSDHKHASLIAWTRVHAVTNLNTCAKSGISGNDQWAYLMTRGGAKSLRSLSRFPQASSDDASSDGCDLSRFRDRGAPRGHTGSSDLHQTGDASEIHGGVGSIRSSSRSADTWTKMARSIVIKYAIEISQAIFIGRLKDQDLIATRSWSYHDEIVTRSWSDRLSDAIGWLTRRHVATRGAPNLHQSGNRTIEIGPSIQLKLNRTAAIVRDLFDARGAITIGGSPSDGANTSWKNSTIAV